MSRKMHVAKNGSVLFAVCGALLRGAPRNAPKCPKCWKAMGWTR